MGKVVQIKAPYDFVTLPINGGTRSFRTGASTTLTDAEYSALAPADARAVTVTSTVADPARTATAQPQSLSEALALAKAYALGKPTSPALADGQTVVWSATLGALVATNPSGAAELAWAVNTTGVVTTASAAGALGTAVDIPSSAINVLNSNGRPVTINWEANALQTVAGIGNALLSLVETTSGSTSLTSVLVPLPNSIVFPMAFLPSMKKAFRIGAVTTTRSFKLQIQLWAPSANSPTITVLNAGNNPTMIQAIAG